MKGFDKMRKLKIKKRVIVCLIILMVLWICISKSQSQADTNKIVETNKKQAEVTQQTIATTLTASGEVESSKLEKLYLNTNYSFLTLCAEVNEQVKKGENLLKYTNGTYLVAPYDCVIVSYSIPKAKSACTSNDYIYISSTEELNMNININEEQINNISVGQEVEIVVSYDESKVYQGTISQINEIGTYENGVTNFSAIVSMKNDGNLRLGMSATCKITIEKLENVIAVPIEAVEIEKDKKQVNKITNNGTEKVEIKTGKANENYVQVLSGLSNGDKIEYETTTIRLTQNAEQTETKSLFNFGEKKPNSKKGGF